MTFGFKRDKNQQSPVKTPALWTRPHPNTDDITLYNTSPNTQLFSLL